MAHAEQKEYCLSVKNRFPDFFRGKFVLDIGSLDINGNNQYLFEDCGYLGVDISEGRNIDIVSKGHELTLPDECFDVIISTECFEHDPFYEKTISNIYRMLKPGGLFMFSCATTGRPEHGTRRTSPHDAPLTQSFGEWGDYYKNLEEADVRAILDIDSCFSEYEFQVQNKTHDIYFWGKKSGLFVSRSDYSFMNLENSFQKRISSANNELVTLKAETGKIQGELIDAMDRLEHVKIQLATSEEARIKIENQIKEVHNSKSWKLTKPLRFIARLIRGEYQEAFGFVGRKGYSERAIKFGRKVKRVLTYLVRGDIRGLINRVKFHRREANLIAFHNVVNYKVKPRFGILTPGHTLFVANLIAEQLQRHGWDVDIINKSLKEWRHELYFVICPQIFSQLPPGEKRICFQMEQSVSSRWFTAEYNSILENSLAVLEYSLTNIEYLDRIKISYPHVHYMPIGALVAYGEHVKVSEKIYDVVFYGDSLSSSRRQVMLDALKEKYNVHIVNNLFGDEMIRVLKQAKVVVNIHYYENALLEMPRIQECLSLGLRVVSESSQDQDNYPELGKAVKFFKEGSISEMISAVDDTLKSNDQTIEAAVDASQKRFAFMFDRFLVSMNFLPSSHVEKMELPVPDHADIFGLSLPETITRRRIFEDEKPIECITFDGIRRRPGWIGCGLSYAALARHALRNNLKTITVMEDDVILPGNYRESFDVINSYLNSKNGEWDVFSGVIASLNKDAKILNVEEYLGRTFVTIDKMTSTVFNVYSESALQMLCKWNPENEDATTNTIDRFLENQKEIRVIVMLPFFVGHREEVISTLWGFQNTTYCQMISDSEKLLNEKKNEFLMH